MLYLLGEKIHGKWTSRVQTHVVQGYPVNLLLIENRSWITDDIIDPSIYPVGSLENPNITKRLVPPRPSYFAIVYSLFVVCIVAGEEANLAGGC